MAEEQGIGQQLIGSIPESPKISVVGKGNHPSTAHSLHFKGHCIGDQFRIDFWMVSRDQRVLWVLNRIVKTIGIRLHIDVGVPKQRQFILGVSKVYRVA